MARPGKLDQERGAGFPRQLCSGLIGVLLGISLLKFGNPVVVSKWVDRPSGAWEWLFLSWPAAVGYGIVAVVAVVGVFSIPWRSVKLTWPLVMPLLWMGWQWIAATNSIDPSLSGLTLEHFAACLACFYLGYFGLGGIARGGWVWLGILCGFGMVLAVGWQQHFGGLAETRRYFQLYVYPTLHGAPPELIKRMESGRIFSTLFYPNTLAGALLLLLPAMLAFLWHCERWLARDARIFLVFVVGGGALACLYWSGSKGGWLLMLLLGLLSLLRLSFARKWKVWLVTGVLLVGLAGFTWRYASFFRRGATSVTARFDYWQAALQTAAAHPVCGSGPGTFGQAYRAIKRPESEMSLEVHNDYLEQASDSGLPGFLTYTSFVLVAVIRGLGRCRGRGNWPAFAVWLGLLGWCLQGLFEFGLYIPAVAWPAFAFMGWLLAGPANPIDSRPGTD